MGRRGDLDFTAGMRDFRRRILDESDEDIVSWFLRILMIFGVFRSFVARSRTSMRAAFRDAFSMGAVWRACHGARLRASSVGGDKGPPSPSEKSCRMPGGARDRAVQEGRHRRVQEKGARALQSESRFRLFSLACTARPNHNH